MEQALINYYGQRGFYSHLQAICLDALKKRGDDNLLLFWKAFASIMERSTAAGIRTLQELQAKRPRGFELAIPAALLYAHELSKIADRDTVQPLQSQLQSSEASATPDALLLVANFYWLVGQYDTARTYVQKCMSIAPNSIQAQTLRGWIDVTCGRPSFTSGAEKFFDMAIDQGGGRNVEALLGRAICQQNRNQLTNALETMNQICALFEAFARGPGIYEKAKLLVAMGAWDEAAEQANGFYESNKLSPDAVFLFALIFEAKLGKFGAAAGRIQELLSVLDKREPKNPRVFMEMAQPLARLAGRNPGVLRETLALVDRAIRLDPTNADYYTEAGNQYIYAGDTASAMKQFRQAMSVNQTNVQAVIGVIKCQLLDGALDDAEQQLEFLNEISSSVELKHLMSILIWKKNANFETSVGLLDEAVKGHLDFIKTLPPGIGSLKDLNPDFMLELASDYLMHCGTEPREQSEPASPLLERAQRLLETVVRHVPGSVRALTLLARCRYLARDLDGAASVANEALNLDTQAADVHILMAKVFMTHGKLQMAQSSLQEALSSNFSVRESPEYLLVDAQLHESAENLEEANKTLELAMRLPGVRKVSGRGSDKQVDIVTRATVYVNLGLVKARLNQMHEATKILGDAAIEFRGTSEEVRVLMGNAQLALQRGDSDSALTTLRGVSPDRPNFLKVMTMIANIYLTHRNDKRMYARTYKELAESFPSVHTYLILGDAYMNIQEPEMAIAVYESALKLDPSDFSLAAKIGKALVKTHDYRKAIEYYETAAKGDPSKAALRFDLAELYTRLRAFEDAQRVIQEALSHPAVDDARVYIIDAKMMMLLAKVHLGEGNVQQAIQDYCQAFEIQKKVMTRLRGEQPDVFRQQVAAMGNICITTAELYAQERVYEQAVLFYTEALRHDKTNDRALCELARLHLKLRQLGPCQERCMELLQLNPGHEEVSIMIADIKFQSGDLVGAKFYFEELLHNTPNHFEGLARLVDLLRRAGKLEEVQPFIETAEDNLPEGSLEPGLEFCKGILARYMNNPTKAMIHLNHARSSHQFKDRALVHMIEICINPDDDTLGGETFQEGEGRFGEGPRRDDPVATAVTLLKELPANPKTLKHRVLEAYVRMATKSKADIESALGMFQDIVRENKDYVPGILGQAIAHTKLKQEAKARTALKNVKTLMYNADEADSYEGCYLLLADIWINSAKYDTALELLKLALSYNESCAKAYEYKGFINEKEQAYKDAAIAYERAWILTNESKPSIGFKLAFNYLKDGRHIDAVNVCHKVLKMHADYPKIRKEILEQARLHIKP